ncbi:MAG TPA: hypothetical protein VFE36_12190 [Candidatus Baltobacteraceae bacterium]|jgi:hypothetical protein|nr:hypothetical protein [Candidatus Baltobacteraceae bacterium]
MFAAILLAAVTLAQAPAAQPAAGTALEPLGTGPCLDSTRPVPRVLQSPISHADQIVRIDRVVSSSTMMPGQTIGFLYTLADGSTWLGQRGQEYMSGAAAAQMNQVLSSTHVPGQSVNEFPPQMKHGVATKYTQFFKVQIVPSALETLRIELAPCVVWPAGRPLPDPQM